AGTRSAMARYFSFPLLLMALLMISTVIPSVSSKNTSLDKKKPPKCLLQNEKMLIAKVKKFRAAQKRMKLGRKPK
uniref:Secreted protein n=1 Tax=Haemonchus contortus TaxID=6289 RepID=A0A7I5E5S3_HAECO